MQFNKKNIITVLFFLQIPVCAFSQVLSSFNCSGNTQTYTIPAGVCQVKIKAWGGGGAGGGIDGSYFGGPGGGGSYSETVVNVTPGDILTVYVGCKGMPGIGCLASAPGGAGGWGYGKGGNGGNGGPGGCSGSGGGGGGSSGVLLNGNLVVVASGGGGGGGGGCTSSGGNGGAGGVNGGASTCTGGGITGGNAVADGAIGLSHAADGGGGGGGGGGAYHGGNGGFAPPSGASCNPVNDCGAGGGGGGDAYTSAGSITNGNGSTPGNNTDPDLCGGCSQGGGNQTAGNSGYVVIISMCNCNIISASNTGPYCEGDSILLNSSGGTQFNWIGPSGFSSTAQNPVIPGAASALSGDYTVTVSDAGGCSANATTTVVVNAPPPLYAGADLDVCTGSGVTLTATGGTNYIWDNGVTNGVSFIPVSTNIYAVTTTDSNGCSATDDVTVTINPLPTAIAGADQTVCTGTSVILSASGGINFNWDNGVTDGVSFTPVSSDNFSVTVTDGNGCTATDDVTVTLNPLPTAMAGTDQTVCTGASVTLTATGGITFNWDNGVTNSVPFTPVATNIYTVTVTDTNGCSATDDVTVSLNPLPTANAGTDQAVCLGGSVILTATGGTIFNWNNGVINGVSFAPVSTNNYTVTVTDINGCTATDDVTVTVNPLPTANAGADQAVCTGSAATLTASGGTIFNWDNGIINGVAFIPASTNTYTVTVTDANGCSFTDDVVITVNASLTANAGMDQDICAGNSIILTASGGVNYNWNNGVINGVAFIPASTNTYFVTVSDANGCSATDDVTITVNPLPIAGAGTDQVICAGTIITLTASGGINFNWDNGVINGVSFTPVSSDNFSVTVTDANGCTASDEVTITVNPLPQANAGANQTVCAGDGVTLSASGGINYMWNNGVTNGVLFTPAATNNYIVTVTDANGCSASDNVSVSVNPLPIAGAGANQNVCSGTAVILSASGGINYIWNNGVSNGVPFIPASTAVYVVTVSDANGCSATSSVTVTVSPGITVTISATNELCGNINGSATANVTGGTGVFSYQWSNGQTTSTINGLAAGTYSVNVKDGICQANATSNIINVPGPVAGFSIHPKVLTIMDGPVSFIDNSSGNIISWIWDFGDGSPYGSGVNINYQYPAPGVYPVSLMVTDNNDCTDTISDTVKVRDIYTFYAPNAFTPNGNGINDLWMPQFLNADLRVYECNIFDRWGNLMFSTANPYVGWNGTKFNNGTFDDVVQGVYVYTIKLKEIDGFRHEYYGKIVLMP